MYKTCSTICQKQHKRQLKDKLNQKKQDDKVKQALKKAKQIDNKRFSRKKLTEEADRLWSMSIRERDK